uniref:Gem-associated protein 2 n=1 Tax=Strongyloides papillosus TaxID=174720 RepID=A0A0N5BBY2_STREA
MEQTPFIEVSDFDRNAIDLSKPAHTAEEYIKQGIVLREKMPKVVRAEISEDVIEKVDIPLFRLGDSLPKCDFIPPCKWTSAQIRMFMSQRIQYLTFYSSNDEGESQEMVELPKENEDWLYFCTGIKTKKTIGDNVSVLQPVNPSPCLLKKMDVKDKNSCLYSLTEYIQSSDKPIKNVFLWIYSLLLSLPLPLSPNTTSTLRTLSKRCHYLRSKLTPTTDKELIFTYSMIITIIGNCYSQKDLADYKL